METNRTELEWTDEELITQSQLAIARMDTSLKAMKQSLDDMGAYILELCSRDEDQGFLNAPGGKHVE